ncbi:cytochrome c oxidase accessory protein CcoG [Colwellia sp. RSH04]|uniref:cytochrome c oxidase accessory protein CcoG n=1 Tax=Colwellia sp. RSH04 TaxID=2305464 RepID=UPI000E574376|nr:cytochrome c oxidase accessory protein CcoG [Colwellia sp. RSH04]RHW76299.1 cytochrome c oxidase accessory protein CcoG [Colwellia sp. RSH04]
MKFDIKEEQLIIKPYENEGNIQVREQKGHYQGIRRKLSWLLMITFMLVPFISYNGQQAVLLNISEQQFRIFAITFWPQDFIFLAGIFMVAAFALFFVTAWLGRVWCGYTCPQTIWTLAYVWVEHRIEGSRNKRIALNKKPWSIEKINKKIQKHSIWFLMSFLTATTFVSYFVPVVELYSTMLSFEWSGLITFWVFFFALCTYGNAGYLREKVCTHMCPYARFQSAMFDKDTLIVAYDSKRGESRGRRKRKDDPKTLGLGDCVDCNLCVEVCPVGIDIRNGLQYECINCALCVDACDQTMDKFGYEPGLISYTSEQQLAGKKSVKFSYKLFGYACFTVLITALMIFWLYNRIPLEVSVLRDRNVLYRMNYEGHVENIYTLKILNKHQQALNYTIDVQGISDVSINVPDKLLIGGGQMLQIPVTLATDGYNLDKKMTNIRFVVKAIEHPSTLLSKDTVFFRD